MAICINSRASLEAIRTIYSQSQKSTCECRLNAFNIKYASNVSYTFAYYVHSVHSVHSWAAKFPIKAQKSTILL